MPRRQPQLIPADHRSGQISFPDGQPSHPTRSPQDAKDFHRELQDFCEFNQSTKIEQRQFAGLQVPVYTNEFWTSEQRKGHSLHEISYRACFKPQLPAFFIRRFCQPGDVVYDPFMGRGTSLIEAQLYGCRVVGNDANPLSRILTAPRLQPPPLDQIEKRLREVSLPTMRCSLSANSGSSTADLLAFFAPKTLAELCGWKDYFRHRQQAGQFDGVDAWIQMVACNRLTGHSKGFFSVFTLPPNQAASVDSQKRINQKRKQQPEYRNTKALILRKSRQLLRHQIPAHFPQGKTLLLNDSAHNTSRLPSEFVRLAVTSPPFLDTVDYIQDNWLRMWFCGLNIERKNIWQIRSLEEWCSRMADVLRELRRVLMPGGWIAFEVGEIRRGSLCLENEIVKAGLASGLHPNCILIHSQHFTKTANCWGISNNSKGTNSNRIIILKK